MTELVFSIVRLPNVCWTLGGSENDTVAVALLDTVTVWVDGDPIAYPDGGVTSVTVYCPGVNPVRDA